jgi:ribosomal protein S30
LPPRRQGKASRQKAQERAGNSIEAPAPPMMEATARRLRNAPKSPPNEQKTTAPRSINPLDYGRRFIDFRRWGLSSFSC